MNYSNQENTDLSGYSKQKEIIDKIYEYLVNNAVGYEKRIKSNVFMKAYDIKDNKTFRKYIEAIRNDDNKDLIVCSEAGHKGGYWIATSQEEIYDTLSHLYKRSMQMLKTYSKLKRKGKLDNQCRLKLDLFETEIVKSILEVE